MEKEGENRGPPQGPTPYCPKCGQKLRREMKFCPKCGSSVETTARFSERGPVAPDVLGFASVGAILIILALTYVRHPISISKIVDYIQRMAYQKAFIKPPLAFFDAAVFFLCAAGVWGIILSGLRIIFQRSVGKSLGDLVGGFFSFFTAYLLTNYAADVFTGRTTLAYFVMAVGLIVVVYSMISLAFPERR